MAYRIRAVKKAAKEPMEILRKEAFFFEFYERHRKGFIWVSGIVALGLVAGFIAWQIASHQGHEAWAMEDEATRLYHENPQLTAILEKKELKDTNEHFRKALELFQRVVQEYPRTAAAPVSQYYIGNTHFELKEYDQAIQAYQTFLDKYGKNGALSALVQSKLAYVLQQTGKSTDALKTS